MRFIIALLRHETSSFSPVPTELERFGDNGPRYGADVAKEYGKAKTALAAFLHYARDVRADVVTPIGAHAKPSAPVSGETFEKLIAPIIEAARDGCDAMLLDLHGAMLTETLPSA